MRERSALAPQRSTRRRDCAHAPGSEAISGLAPPHERRTIRSVGQSARQRTLSERPRGDQVACDAVASIERPHAIEGDVLTRRSRARRACSKSASALTRP